MRQRFPILGIIWKCGCGICHSLNFILALLALHLTFLILLNSMEKVIPLPDILTRWAIEQSIQKEYSVDWTNAVFDLRGGLYLENATITNRSTGENVLRAESARINWAILHLITRSYPPFDELDASRIEVYLPAGYSMSGLNEAAISIDNLSIKESGGILELRDLQVRTGDLYLRMSGSAVLDEPLTGNGNGEGNGPRAFLPQFYNAVARIQRLSPDLEAMLEVQWLRPEGGDQQFDIQFILPVVRHAAGKLEKIDGYAALAYSEKKVRHYRMEVSGYLTEIKPSEQSGFLSGISVKDPILFQASATGKPVSLGAVPLPSDLEITLASIGNPFQFFELAQLSTSLDSDLPEIRGVFSGPHLFLSGTATPDDPTSTDLSSILRNPIKAAFRAQLDDASLAYFFPNYPKVRLLDGTRAGKLRLEAVFRSDPFSIDGTLFADDIHIGATDFANLHSQLFIDRQNLLISKGHVQISADEFATSGGYSHHFPSSRFAILAMGFTRPQTLDALLGKWWLNVFKNLHTDTPAWGDVAVWGQWRDKTSLQSITDAIGEGASYRDYPIPRMKVRVRSNYDWVVLNRFEGLFGEDRILGSVAWRLTRDPDALQPMLLDFASTAPWEAVIAASGLQALSRYELSGNPEVTARGIVWNPPKNNKSQVAIPDLQVRLNTYEESFNTGHLLLSNLNLNGHVGPERVNFDTVSGTFADGIFTGSFALENWSDRDRLTRHLNIQLFDADYREAALQLTELLSNPDPLRNALLKDTTKGRADADLKLQLVNGAVFLSSGNGRVTLRQADIGQIHLLGGLSRSLDGVGMGFSSLDLDSASLEWRLKDGIFDISQCLITGPVLNLSVDGNIDLQAQQIDLQANVMLFRGLASHVFAPVGDSFQFDLTGNLDAPEWQVRMNPFRWFQNRIFESPEDEEL